MRYGCSREQLDLQLRSTSGDADGTRMVSLASQRL
jgi:hypothetical protein